MKAIQIKEYGTPEVLHWQEVEEPAAPAAGQARVRLMVAGLNYIDVYRRSGNYPESLTLPLIARVTFLALFLIAPFRVKTN